ncbi:4Fe-4S dicluster domain-containing protein [Pantoea alhagi]|uniref:4Fe-4S dicluster domain-containing protein n=1 Tax=Pantoea alhagi TaxID=1891675 RepID=UPI00202AE104|nr:4Fe-4S dicluster domain-containing protein [Pantoea alhagi]URQ61672.1 4Fe-4S dicluster domain-containing protein [Pantoea alhagi]
MTDFILVDAQRCIACRTCEVACAQAHLPQGGISKTAFFPRLSVYKSSQASAPAICHQCENAPCVGACPTGALTLDKHLVQTNASRCIGCKNCIVACPFGAISIEPSGDCSSADIIKCDLCAAREAGPACVEVCPTFALRLLRADELGALKDQRAKETGHKAFLLHL